MEQFHLFSYTDLPFIKTIQYYQLRMDTYFSSVFISYQLIVLKNSSTGMEFKSSKVN